MLRKLNFTERARIPRSAFAVTVRRGTDGIRTFDVRLELAAVRVPSDARVFLEAAHGTSFMRFDCGNVGDVRLPDDRRLTEIDSSSIRFRLKIVDAQHRILALADGVRVSDRGAGSGSRTPLLPVQFSDGLGEQAWRVLFEPDGAVLELNNRVPDIEKTAKEDALFFALVYPAAVRQILTRILLVDRYPARERSAEWWSLWIQWGERFATGPLPADEEEAQGWIDDVVAAFCDEHRAVSRVSGVEPS